MNTEELYDKYLITSMVSGFEPIDIIEASGCTVTGSDGRQYLDCFSGISVCNAGHNHPRVVAAAKEQADKLVHCCTYLYYSPRAGECAAQLARITPGRLQKSFFANSGAEAIEGAMRIAKQHTGHKEFIGLEMSFHGRTNGTLSLSGCPQRKQGGEPYLPGVAFAPVPYCYRCPLERSYPECKCACAKAIAGVIENRTNGDIAALVAEPVLGEGGIIVPPAEYFKIACDIVHRAGGIFICDEVQTGFGRTGTLFAIEHYNVEPDIICMAKGIADGFPLSAFTVTAEIAEAFEPGDHLSTFGGNPVSCAAAIANIDVLLEEQLPQAANARGHWIMHRLQSISREHDLVGDVRGKGLMIGIELISSDDKTPAATGAAQLRALCREAGVLVGVGGTYGNVLRIQPPLTISEAECERALDVIKDALQQIGA